MPVRQASTGGVPTLPGIQNLGNTCFLNSVLQALNATHPLPELLTLPSNPSAVAHPLLAYLPGPSAHPEPPPSPIPITLALAHLFRHLSASSAAAIRPSTLIKELAQKREEYASYEQQDSHELLRVLVDGLRMEELDLWKALDPLPPRPAPTHRPQHAASSSSSDSSSSTSSSTSSATLVDPSAPPPPKREPLVDTLFCGALTQFIVCSHCRHVSRTTEDFLDLSLSLSPTQPGAMFEGADEGRRIGKRERFRRSIQDRLRASANTAGGSSSSGRSSPSSRSASEGSSDEERAGRKARRKKTGFWSREASPARRAVSLDRGGDNVSRQSSRRSLPATVGSSRDGAGVKLSPEKQDYLEKVLAEVPPVQPPPGHGVHALRFAHPDPSRASLPSSSSSSTAGSVSTGTGPAGHETQLYTLLRQFTSVETLEGENVFACRNCWRLARRQLSLKKREQAARARSDTIMPGVAHSSTESLEREPVAPKSPKRPALTVTAPSSTKTVRRDTLRGIARDETEGSRLTSSSEETGGDSADAESDGGVVGGEAAGMRRKKKLKPVVLEPEAVPSKIPKPLQYVLRPAEKRYLVSSLPPILVIHLKRFGQQAPSFLSPYRSGGLPSFLSRATAGRIGGVNREASFSEFRKIDDFVSFPERLDLAAFMAPAPPVRPDAVRKQGRRGTVMAVPSMTATTTAKTKPKRTLVKPWLSHLFHHHRHPIGDGDETYRLYATVNHIGTLGAGHYVANVLSDQWKPDPTSTSVPAETPAAKERRWMYASDTTVRMTTLEEVLHSKAYLLFYERVGRHDDRAADGNSKSVSSNA